MIYLSIERQTDMPADADITNQESYCHVHPANENRLATGWMPALSQGTVSTPL